MSLLRAFFGGLLLSLLAAGPAWAVSQTDISVGTTYYTYDYLTAGTTVTWEVRNLPFHCDSILHLQTLAGGYLDGDDDGGSTPRGSLVSHTASGNEWVMLVLREKNNVPNCWGQLYRNGVSQGTKTIGGTFISRSFDAGDEIITAKRPSGVTATMVLVINGGNTRAVAYDNFDGVGMFSKAIAPENASGVHGLFVWTPFTVSTPAPVRLFVNDTASDDDCDGVGDVLEGAIGTDPFHHDTDRDGLEDGWELFGYEASPPQHLPAWGATPRHMDVFVEVDWQDGNDGVGEKLHPDAAILANAIFGDSRALEVNNPDGLPGIALHLDTGVPSANTIYGDWGGANGVNIECPDTSQCWRTAAGMSSGFTPARRGLFFYSLGYGVSCGGGWGDRPGYRTGYGAGCTDVEDLIARGQTLAHELGHNLGLAHGGEQLGNAYVCKPNYPSIMNYAYGTPASVPGYERGFSRGDLPSLDTAALCEADGLGSSADSGMLGGDAFEYLVQGAGVDWNRDGSIDSCAQSHRGHVTWAPGATICPTLSEGRTVVTTLAPPRDDRDVAAAVFDGGIYAFYVDTSDRLIMVDRDASGAWSLGTVVPTHGGVPVTSAPGVANLPINGVETLHLFYDVGVGQGRFIKYQTYSVSGGWSTAITTPGQSWPSDEQPDPSVSFAGDKVLLMYRYTHGGLRQLWLDDDGDFGTEKPVQDNGVTLSSDFPPDIMWGTRYGLFSGTFGTGSGGAFESRWSPYATGYGGADNDWPVMNGGGFADAWTGGIRPTSIESPNQIPDRSQMWFVNGAAGQPGSLSRMILASNNRFDFAGRVVSKAEYRNAGHLLYWFNDDHLHHLVIRDLDVDDVGGVGQLVYRPIADGAVNEVFEDNVDFVTMRDQTCNSLRRGDGTTQQCLGPKNENCVVSGQGSNVSSEPIECLDF